MVKPVVKRILEEKGFSFSPSADGNEIAQASSSLKEEYHALRNAVAFGDLSPVMIYEVTGNQIVEFLDYIVAGEVGLLREEHVLHSLCLSESGEILTEVYVANDEERFFLFADGGEAGLVDRFLREQAQKYDVRIASLNDSHTLFAVDGPYAWKPVKEVFGPEILGLRYLSFIVSTSDGESAYVFRSGKTGEYGYWVLNSDSQAEAVYRKLASSMEGCGFPVVWYGKTTSDLVRLENHFLNLDAEGKYTRNPYELGFFWMIRTHKEMVARVAVQEMLQQGISRSVIGVTLEDGRVQEGEFVFYQDTRIGTLVARGFCYAKETEIGLALLDKSYCYSGLTFEAGEHRTKLRTISIPFLANKSLTTKIE